jgi:hypothetical protein
MYTRKRSSKPKEWCQSCGYEQTVSTCKVCGKYVCSKGCKVNGRCPTFKCQTHV